MDDDLDLATMLCSRLCHDLISPVGAIGNGLELLDAPSAAEAEVRTLLVESARSAQAALGFFRLAFGSSSASASTHAAQELGELAAAYFAGGRRRLDWPLVGDPLPRPASQLLLLLLLAGATATPIGGVMQVASPLASPLSLRVVASGRRAGLSNEAAGLLQGALPVGAASPRDAHLPLAARVALRLGAQLSIEAGEESVTIMAQG